MTDAAALAAFKIWMNQYNAEDWSEQYATLVNAQKRVITEKRYSTCRDKAINPEFKLVKLVSAKPNVQTKIPGTSVTAKATRLTVRVKVGGLTLPIPVHMFYEEGEWRWSLNALTRKGCW